MYRGLRLAARAAPKLSLYNTSAALRQLPLQFQHVRTYADKIVKVPTMAESISEGTLKQWNKAIGDFVEQDEEIATIETDKVRGREPRADPAQLMCTSACPKTYTPCARSTWPSTPQKPVSSRSSW